MSLPCLRADLVRRLAWETEAVRVRFGRSVRLVLDEKGLPCWHGSVPIEGQAFAVIVTYPLAAH